MAERTQSEECSVRELFSKGHIRILLGALSVVFEQAAKFAISMANAPSRT